MRSARGVLAPGGVILALLAVALHAQSVQIATWRHGATGAYSIIMDDYGGGDLGLRQYADSMLVNRGFAVTVDIIVGSCTPQNWAYARELFSHGHKMASHSWNHLQQWGPADFPLQIDSSKAVIEREVPGSRCLFFGFPYEVFNDTMITYFRTREYIGTRGGNFHGSTLNPPAIPDPFRSNFEFYGSETGLSGLNTFVAWAISRGGWALRETHQVLYNQGYNPIAPDSFAMHLDFCRQKADSGLLWMAPVQEVIMYARERETYTAAVTAQGPSQITIEFTTDASRIHPSPTVANTLYDYPLTLLLQLPGGFTDPVVWQADSVVSHTVAAPGTIRFDALPYGGPVTVASNADVRWRPAVRDAAVAQPRPTAGCILATGRGLMLRAYSLLGGMVASGAGRCPSPASGLYVLPAAE
jgi:hypothetical protein